MCRYVIGMPRSKSNLVMLQWFLTVIPLECRGWWWNFQFPFIIIPPPSPLLRRREGILLCCCLSVHQQFLFIFFALVAHTEIKLSRSKFCFRYDRAIFERVMPLGLQKTPIIYSFLSFSLQKLLFWNEIWYTDSSLKYLGQVLFRVRSNNFWQWWPLD
jgi:hypothetical protein